MKTTQASELTTWEHTHDHEAQGRQHAQARLRPIAHVELASSHGVDGSDELAAAFGKGAGGVCVASGFFSAAHDGRSGHSEKEAGTETGAASGGSASGVRRESVEGGAWSFRDLS